MYLQARVTVLLQQDLDHGHMTFVDSQVEWRLLALVPGIEVDRALGQDGDDLWLVPQSGMVDSTVTILVLSAEREGHMIHMQAKSKFNEDCHMTHTCMAHAHATYMHIICHMHAHACTCTVGTSSKTRPSL